MVERLLHPSGSTAVAVDVAAPPALREGDNAAGAGDGSAGDAGAGDGIASAGDAVDADTGGAGGVGNREAWKQQERPVPCQQQTQPETAPDNDNSDLFASLLHWDPSDSTAGSSKRLARPHAGSQLGCLQHAA